MFLQSYCNFRPQKTISQHIYLFCSLSNSKIFLEILQQMAGENYICKKGNQRGLKNLSATKFEFYSKQHCFEFLATSFRM